MSKQAIQHGKPVSLPPEYSTLAQMLIHIAQKYPGKGVTFIDVAGNEDFESYPELVEAGRRCLYTLTRKGVKPGDVLILEIDTSKDFYHTFWACVFGGIIPAPISPPASWDPDSTGLLKLTKVWEVLRKPMVVIEEKDRKRYQLLQDSPQYPGFTFVSAQELLADEQADILPTEPDDLVFLQFSSGSTGTPKGVQLTNKNILTNNIAFADALEAKAEDTVFTWLPHTHDMGLFAQYLLPIVCGSNIMKFSPATFIRSPYLFLKKITEHRGTWFCSPNFGFEWLTQKVSDEKLAFLDLSCLRLALNGAEPISISVINNFIEKFSKCGFKESMMFPAYGMAEATVAVNLSKVGSVPRIERIYRSKMINENRAVPVEDENEKNQIEFVHEGYPIGALSVRIADEQGNTLDENMIGEIQIRGGSVTSGYYNREDLTKEMFVDGWLHTGDLGFMVDNSLVVSGRIKDILFIRGQNYFAHDLEEIIYGLGTIQRGNLALVGLFNEKTDQEELLAFVRHKRVDNLLPLRQRIIDRMREALGIEINHVIPVRKIPKTSSGKLQRFELRKCYANGDYAELLQEIAASLEKNREQEREIHLPQTELEIFLHQTWAKILNLSALMISTDDPFFSLGGNSIKAFQLLGEIEKHLGREVGHNILASCKTIQQIAEYIESMPAPATWSFADWQPDNKLDIGKAVAITGLALRFPRAGNQQEFWENLCSRKDCIAKVSPRRRELSGYPDWDDWLAELDNIDSFDNDFFEIPAGEAVFMDPQQRLLLETSYEALEDAGYVPGSEEEHNVGVYAGISATTYYPLVVDYMKKNGVEGIHQNTMVGNMPNIISAIISHTHNFTGPALTMDTACSSFLVALHHAVAALRQKQICGALVAGANILATPLVHFFSRKAGILSSTRYTKVFDKDADGSVLGEGVMVVYLERLTDAIKVNKNIYGVIRGTAINNDGYSLGIMAPNPKGQYQVLVDAYRDANLSPGEISYIEAHGTGTIIGDPIEINALSKLFTGGKQDKTRDIRIGSVKTNIGHLLPAAGAAGLAKVLLCFKNQQLVPNMHFENVNSLLELEKSPFHIMKEVQPWPQTGQKKRKAGVSSFGLGGTNAHIVLEEWNNPRATMPRGEEIQLLTMSAKSGQALKRVIHQTRELIETNPALDIHNLCFTRNRYRRHYGYRAACFVSAVQKTEGFRSLWEGQFIKNHSARVCLMIGDLKSHQGMQGRGFEKDFEEILELAIKHKILDPENLDRNGLLGFVYGYSSVRKLKEKGLYVCDVRGINSGAPIADFFNEKIDLADALRLYFKTGAINSTGSIDQQSLRKVDIVLGLGMTEDQILKIVSNEVQNKLQYIPVELEADSSREIKTLSLMAELYVAGADFDWKCLHPEGSGQLIYIPPYPFERKSFWVNQ